MGMPGKGKGGGGGGGGGSPELSPEQINLINTQIGLLNQAGAQQQLLFDQLQHQGLQSQQFTDYLTQQAIPSAINFQSDIIGNLLTQSGNRTAMSQAALAQIPGLAEGFRGISAPFASLAGQAQRLGNTPLDTALLRQYAGQAAGFRQADPGITALAQQLSTQFGGSLTPAQVSSLAQEIARSGRRAGEEVSPVRSNVLGLLGDVAAGKIGRAHV